MSMVPAICTQCGARLEVDNSTEAAVCKFCNTPFIIEKAITNYNASITQNNASSTVNNDFSGANVTVINEGANFSSLIKNGENMLSIGKYDEAYNLFMSALNICPENGIALIMLGLTAFVQADYIEAFQEFSKGLSKAQNNDEMIAMLDQFIEPVADWYSKYRISDSNKQFKITAQGCFVNDDVCYCVITLLNDISQNFDFEGATRDIYISYYKLVLALYETYGYEYWNLSGSPKRKRSPQIMQDIFENYLNVVPCSAHMPTVKPYEDKIADIIRQEGYLFKDWEQLNKYASKYNVTPMSGADFASKKAIDEKRKGGCYIATCVYGSYDCPQVWVLRRFRDKKLKATWYGYLFVRTYYSISPTLVKWFGKKEWFQRIWRKTLDKMVYRLKDDGYEDTNYYD